MVVDIKQKTVNFKMPDNQQTEQYYLQLLETDEKIRMKDSRRVSGLQFDIRNYPVDDD